MEKKLIAENELCRIYTNSASESLTQYCEQNLNNLPKLHNHKVFICENKESGNISFVLFNDKGVPIEENRALDGMAIKIEILRYLKGE